MLYAALTLWLLVIMFSAWGVHRIWSAMVKPRVVNAVLLPGTLVAQLGHILGLLVTGNPVQNTQLMGDDDAGEPQAETPDRQRIPVVGPIIIGLLPLIACTGCLYLAANLWGGSVLGRVAADTGFALPRELPTTLAGFWALLRTGVSVSESMLNTILNSDLTNWRSALFVYLAICLTVRMAPFEGNRRGALAAILLSGGVIAILASLIEGLQSFVLSSWPILSFAVGMLLFLLLASLAIAGLAGLIRILARNE